MDTELVLRWLHVIGACVLLGTGAGIAFFMVLAERTGRPALIAHVASTVVVADTLFTGDPEIFTQHLKRLAGRFGVGSEDLKNLTVSALLAKMTAMTDEKGTVALLEKMGGVAKEMGLSEKIASTVIGGKKG